MLKKSFREAIYGKTNDRGKSGLKFETVIQMLDIKPDFYEIPSGVLIRKLFRDTFTER